MFDPQLLFAGFATIASLKVFPFLVLGTVMGIVVGAIPGLTATMAIALLIPFTFAMDPISGIVMLLAIYAGGIYGGGVASILIRTPGTPAAAATLLDGYPMAQKGEAGRAIGIATISSGIGGLFSACALTLFAPLLATVALSFSAPEYFSLAVFGLVVTMSLSGNSLLRGFFSVLCGLTIGMIGIDPIGGFQRMNFGFSELSGGFNFVAVMIGLFSLSEAFRQMEQMDTMPPVPPAIRNVLPRFKEIAGMWTVYVRACVYGLIIGIAPGVGAETSSFLTYAEVKRASKDPSQFGKGAPEGVAAAQAAENGSTGGDLLPMLTLGVPGDAATAVLMGALTIHNLQPGPMLFQERPDLVHQIFAGMISANLMFMIVGLLGARLLAKVVQIDRRILVPLVCLLSLIGAYAIDNNPMDVWVTLFFGVAGWLMYRNGFPVSPLVLAVILGGMMESNLRRTLVMGLGSPAIMLHRPIALLILVLAALSLYAVIRRNSNEARKRKAEEAVTE
ncbi:tripartite tricarboxylate transporter permease [Xanthobacteraceae bacterium Astr-EGSB]|uniref:tripartite tricarboxylate transporter permease n=1 Tax=Astrobacterium formosum TaxID=3069710 RepID=UPI0027B8323A|nr:tripartite tricarboxylate transporter permease [Xanthobacteraceae bacterium Astr-EGSB]